MELSLTKKLMVLVLFGRVYNLFSMKFIKNLFKSKEFLAIMVVLIAGLLASRTLLFQKGYFNMHDDLQIMRQLEMEKCFKDFQIPCRWVPDMGYGFGFPLYNFYPPLPYLVGEIFRLLGFSFIVTVKLTFALSLIASGIGMYYLAKQFFDRFGGIISAIFYIWAPYHSVDVYVRGAMNEAWALIFFPLIFLYSYKLISKKKNETIKWLILLALSWFGLLITHNLMVIIFTPIFGFWCLLWMWKEKNFKIIPKLIISGILALGLSSYFSLPAIFENKFTQVKSQLTGYYEYIAHFVSIKQLLITRFWGYGPSVWGVKDDGMPFQVGHVHWVITLVILALWLIGFYLVKNKKIKLKNLKTTDYLILFLFLVGWFAVFMTHNKSTPIYKLVSPLALVQFPWRFLTIVIFSFSFLAGAITIFVKNKYFLSALIFFVILFNWNYFLPEHGKLGKLTDEEKLSGVAWDMQQTAGIYDYLPIWAETAPKEPQKVVAEIVNGMGEITNTEEKTNFAKFKIETTGSIVRINIFKFPGWKVYIDGKEVDYFVPKEETWGRMWIEVPSGKHSVEAKFVNTPVRTVSNLISLVSWLGLGAYLMLQFKKWKKK
ncbi:MAG: hypothetical protein UR11_C0001G0447 [Candidatus Woesebacteria bacterium GW2011_GWC1_30_29]|uniref:Uncharacterized protein n=1 Tax=Candidatus Woesebacteria bacterium GW2011_GWC2_31_9 TaxID=1618586 RepID=A0A0F9YIM2_9BACT|nr:MAG: hypothetical protein UR11_C0001G0447 [Candidatus Woesebacteria bacterium GW2011_GWC1_30_29]KKP26450.1 MAG: hypothetical protein UR13_C0004G0064 [Candidatus Woesebacteria bacterium GW2011_GWD1_31_12]KKP27749.1 MAG: hypothetical protein UR16_C0002G0079 [Candidatus Woesebacteria bacterium GW2011_GWB1_31_29]KKP31374.1 MAG: hypothetical protein UR21_C0010G0016 [Candidatus Woesebacteria bacterium GW2011_GWC2_31_9]KKP34211.1 MAG: hypothetical protein UR24_C0001G0276 [Candidatus Woesebacteria b